ncbi:MAG: hypothetical protein ACRDWD_15915 [Acidimicrobiia bacterium]
MPTPDHFIPLLYVAGLAAAGNRSCDVLTEGCAMGSLSMTSYMMDFDTEPGAGSVAGSPPLPDVPPEDTNL